MLYSDQQMAGRQKIDTDRHFCPVLLIWGSAALSGAITTTIQLNEMSVTLGSYGMKPRELYILTLQAQISNV